MSTTSAQDKANPPPARVLRILVACEFSGIVRDAFLEKGRLRPLLELGLDYLCSGLQEFWHHIDGDAQDICRRIAGGEPLRPLR